MYFSISKRFCLGSRFVSFLGERLYTSSSRNDRTIGQNPSMRVSTAMVGKRDKPWGHRYFDNHRPPANRAASQENPPQCSIAHWVLVPVLAEQPVQPLSFSGIAGFEGPTPRAVLNPSPKFSEKPRRQVPPVTSSSPLQPPTPVHHARSPQAASRKRLLSRRPMELKAA